MEEYLTVQEISDRIKFSKQSIYNLIYKKKFILGKHYLKPTPKKILFVWSEVEKWLRQMPSEDSSAAPPPSSDFQKERQEPNDQKSTDNRINSNNYSLNPPVSAINI